MIFKNQLAKTFSAIAQALKVSKHNERPLTHIVKVVREHFHAETCSLYEFHKESFVLVAIDKQNRSPRDNESLTQQQKQMEQVAKDKEALFGQETAIVPLIYQEKMVGALILARHSLKGFDVAERQFLEFIALQLGRAVQSLAIAERIKQKINPETQTSFVVRGIPVSSGFGIGPALFLHPGITLGFSAPDLSFHSIKNEWQNLQAALQKTSEDLSHIEKNIKNKPDGASGIFTGHQTILTDTEFLKKLEGEIERGKNALEAVGGVLQEYAQQFDKMKDSRFEDVAVDLEELKQRILENLLGMARDEKEDWTGILIAKSLGPSDTIRLDADRLLGIITVTGGPTSHAAILARSLGIPAIMGATGIMEKIRPGMLLIVDGDRGEAIVNPSRSILDDYERREQEGVVKTIDLSSMSHEPAVTLDGHAIHLEANAGFVSDIKKLRFFGAEGVGLFRTEFLFLKGEKLPTESEQLSVYSQIVKDAAGLPITFRILDAGGDKPMEALPMEKEENPFLGFRSIRLTLSHQNILKTQLRALLRASTLGNIRLLIPMISGMEEVDALQEILKTVKRELTDENIPYDPNIPFGMMIEVPSAVSMVPFLMPHADFFSIGTNDLTQYTLAVDRNNERVASFFEPLHPAVLSFISQVASAGFKAQKPVSICGEIAGDPFIIPLLVGLNITSLSMNLSSILKAKKIIRGLNYQEVQEMANEALKISRIAEIKALLKDFQAHKESISTLHEL